MSKIILTLVSDTPGYRDLLKVFLLSLKEKGGEYRVRANVINGERKYIDSLPLLNKNTEIVSVKIDPPSPIKILYSKQQQTMDALNEGHEQVAWMDADIIFRKKIDGIWENVTENSFKIWDKGSVPPVGICFKTQNQLIKYLKKKRNKQNTRLQGGCYILGNGSRMKEQWKRMMDKIPEKPEGFFIQKIMITEILGTGLNILHLNPIYNDSYFNDSSVMWHGKTGHRENPKWKSVFNEYLIRANNIKQEALCQ